MIGKSAFEAYSITGVLELASNKSRVSAEQIVDSRTGFVSV